MQEAKTTYPVVRDQFNLVARRYLGTKVPLPSVFVLDKTGKILFVSRGYDEEISRMLSATVYRALGLPQPPAKVVPGHTPKHPPSAKPGKYKRKEKRK